MDPIKMKWIRNVIVSVIGLLAIVVVLKWAVWKDDEELVAGDWGGPRPECPYHVDTNYTLPGPITNVPEFHDCQRFIVKKGFFRTKVFGALYAIWVREKLDSVVFPLATLTGPPTSLGCSGPPTHIYVHDSSGLCVPAESAGANIQSSLTFEATGVAVALVYSYGGRYHPLGIEPAFNCLYLYHPGADTTVWQAKMVPVQKEADCFANVNPAAVTGKLLYVRPFIPQGYAAQDYPPVGRWDRDSTTGRYYAGLRCRAAWCEIGPEGFHPSNGYTVASATALLRRTFEIKGWYDEQYLAVPSGNDVVPGPVKGTAFPDPALDALKLSDYDATTWIPVAYTVLHGGPGPYKDKLNFEAGAVPGVMNTVQFCHGDKDDLVKSKERCLPEAWRSKLTCGPATGEGEWWAMITSAAQKDTVYRCVTFRGHPGIVMPGTVRWRWLASDETIWVRCTEGCCQVN